MAKNAEEIRPLLIGSPVPAVSLRQIDGSPLDLEAAVKSQPTVVIFYRGGW